jgi:hypothetical protein
MRIERLTAKFPKSCQSGHTLSKAAHGITTAVCLAVTAMADATDASVIRLRSF